MVSIATVEVPFPRGRTLRVLEHRAAAHDFREWERAAVESVLDYLRPGMVVYDVGAEEGEFSALWAQVVGPGNVHLFEPTPGVWPNIRAVWSANHGPTILDRPGGVFCGFVHDGTPRYYPNEIAGGWPSCARGQIQGDSRFSVVTERPDIGAVSIDQYVQDARPPDVIVCDVEGAEVLVFAGAASVLALCRPEVFVSVHPPEFLSRFPVPAGMNIGTGACHHEHLFGYFSRFGYVGRWISQDHEAHWRFTPRERA